jgi:ferric-dicitrate binding protein FerR (iron transport regulator)
VSEDHRLEWLRLYSEGHASAEITAQLEAEIQRDERFRREVVEYLQLDAALAGAVASISPARVIPFPKKAVIGAIAAALALVATLVWQSLPKQASDLMVDVIESDCVPAVALGSQMFRGNVKIDSGSLRFKMDSGATVEVEAPASFSISSATQLNLHHGNLTADAGGDTIGFVVETVSAHIVDLGTRFGVSVDDQGLTDVVVLEGKVEVFKDYDDARSKKPLASLVEGEAVQVNRGKKTKRLKSVSLRRDALMPNGKHRSKLVADVSDNLDEEGFNRFYAIEPKAMSAGARLHTDKPGPRWQPNEGKNFPLMLDGADIVRTFFHDRLDRDREIRLELNKRATVFIMYEADKPVPAWLDAGFVRTSASLRSGSWRKGKDGDEFFRRYHVWKKAFGAGTVVLGPSHDSSGKPKAAMYGIAVKDARP